MTTVVGSSSSSSKKVLLMGRAAAGKTSMRSIIFANYLARDTRRLMATNNIEHSHLRFLGNLYLSLWDCGGQDVFMENYFESQREHIFSNTEVLIYVIEARTSTLDGMRSGGSATHRETIRDIQCFKATLDSLRLLSPNAKHFVLIHKMDLIPTHDREDVLNYIKECVMDVAEDSAIDFFGTSIWNETLFKAWSAIVCLLVPNLVQLEQHLMRFCKAIAADEIVLFEKSTFLVISCAQQRAHEDLHRFENISNICKQFNLTCGKNQANFTNMTIQNPRFSTFVGRFTLNTYIMVVVSDPEIEVAAMLCNIEFAREEFERLTEQLCSSGSAL